MAEPLLSLAGVHAGYGGTEILRGVNFAVHSGEVVTGLGPNGGGKMDDEPDNFGNRQSVARNHPLPGSFDRTRSARQHCGPWTYSCAGGAPNFSEHDGS